MTVHTHYDNLKVTRKAPLEVIRAAYRAMAQKYHPDHNSSAEATKVMRILNEARDVLTDPLKRAEHDKWIAEQEALENQRPRSTAEAERTSTRTWSDGGKTYTYDASRPFGSKPRPKQSTSQTDTSHAAGPDMAAKTSTTPNGAEPPVKTEIGSSWLWAGVAAVVAIVWLGSRQPPGPTESNVSPSQPAKIIQATESPPGEPNYARCNGSYEVEKCRELQRQLAAETPEQAAQRRERLKRDSKQAPLVSGASDKMVEAQPRTFTFEEATGKAKPKSAPSQALVPFNGELDFVEDPALLRGPSRHLGRVLANGGRSSIEIDNSSGGGDTEVRLYLDDKKPHVRAMLVRGGSSFKSTGIAAGSYVVRWRALGSREVYEANQRAALHEERTEDGVRYSTVKMTLYKVRDGNLRTSKVPESSF